MYRYQRNETKRGNLVEELESMLSDQGLSLSRAERCEAILAICGGTPFDATRRIRSALGAMADSMGGKALANAFALSPNGLDYVDARRSAFAEAEGYDEQQVRILEKAGIRELALRLLGGNYPDAPGGERQPRQGPYLTTEARVLCMVRACRVVQIEHTRSVIAIASSVQPFKYVVTRNSELTAVTDATIVRERTIAEGREYEMLPSASEVERGRSYTFSFVELIPYDQSPSKPPAKDCYGPVLLNAALRYRLDVKFIGERPVGVWAARGRSAADRLPARRHRTRVDTQHMGDEGIQTESVEHEDLPIGAEVLVGWKWRTPRVLLLVLAGVALLLATFDVASLIAGQRIPPDSGIFAAAVSGRVGLSIIAAILTYRYFKLRNRRLYHYSHEHNFLRQLPESNAKALQVGAADSRLMSGYQARIFAAAVTKPREFRQRIVERYEPGRRTLKQTATLEIRVPRRLMPPDADEEFKIFFPMLLPAKAKFLDDLRTVGGDGVAIPVLSYREYLQLAATVLRLLLAAMYGGHTALSIPLGAKAAELDALTLIMARRGPNDDAPGLALNPKWHENLSPGEDPQAQIAKQWAIDFVDLLAKSYALVAYIKVGSDGRGIIQYEQMIIPDLVLSWKGRLGVLLGARPIDLSLALKAASTCRSYHLFVNGGDGVYLGDQRLSDSSATLRKRAVDENIPPHYRFRRRLGQPHAHFYARFFPEPAMSPDDSKRTELPQVRLKYFETPPGSLLRAAASAWAAMFLIWLVGVVSSLRPDPGTDAPAFLLAFPAIVATWLGFEAASRRLLEGTLLARFSLFVTVVSCIAASGLFMGHKALTAGGTAASAEGTVARFEWLQIPPQWSVFWISDISWIVVFFVALVNVIITTILFVRRTAYFTYLSSRRQGDDVQEYV